MPRIHSTPPLPTRGNCFATRTPSIRADGIAAPSARFNQQRESVPHARGVGHIQQHTADLRLVQDVRRQDLHHHRKAEPTGRGNRVLHRTPQARSGTDATPTSASNRLASASLGVRRRANPLEAPPAAPPPLRRIDSRPEPSHRGNRGDRPARVLQGTDPALSSPAPLPAPPAQ